MTRNAKRQRRSGNIVIAIIAMAFPFQLIWRPNADQ